LKNDSPTRPEIERAISGKPGIPTFAGGEQGINILPVDADQDGMIDFLGDCFRIRQHFIHGNLIRINYKEDLCAVWGTGEGLDRRIWHLSETVEPQLFAVG
jgi:hypothetical protein